jgi:hypothetical protein
MSLADYIEAFMMIMYSYFSHSLKDTWNFRNETLEMKGSFLKKMLKQ